VLAAARAELQDSTGAAHGCHGAQGFVYKGLGGLGAGRQVLLLVIQEFSQVLALLLCYLQATREGGVGGVCVGVWVWVWVWV
jgi:hypothetical protein